MAKVRAVPLLSAEVVGHLMPGQIVMCRAKLGDWLQIRFEGNDAAWALLCNGGEEEDYAIMSQRKSFLPFALLPPLPWVSDKKISPLTSALPEVAEKGGTKPVFPLFVKIAEAEKKAKEDAEKEMRAKSSKEKARRRRAMAANAAPGGGVKKIGPKADAYVPPPPPPKKFDLLTLLHPCVQYRLIHYVTKSPCKVPASLLEVTDDEQVAFLGMLRRLRNSEAGVTRRPDAFRTSPSGVAGGGEQQGVLVLGGQVVTGAEGGGKSAVVHAVPSGSQVLMASSSNGNGGTTEGGVFGFDDDFDEGLIEMDLDEKVMLREMFG